MFSNLMLFWANRGIYCQSRSLAFAFSVQLYILNASNFATFFFLFHESECKFFHHDINSQLVLFSFLYILFASFLFMNHTELIYVLLLVFFFSFNMFNFVVQCVCVCCFFSPHILVFNISSVFLLFLKFNPSSVPFFHANLKQYVVKQLLSSLLSSQKCVCVCLSVCLVYI